MSGGSPGWTNARASITAAGAARELAIAASSPASDPRVSGIWFPLDGAPDWLVSIAHFFPLAHIVNAFGGCFVPGSTGSGFSGGDLGENALWTAAGLLVAVRRFRWEP